VKTAVVTGAAKPESIGREVALRLQKEGMQVIVLDLYEEGFSSLPKTRYEIFRPTPFWLSCSKASLTIHVFPLSSLLKV